MNKRTSGIRRKNIWCKVLLLVFSLLVQNSHAQDTSRLSSESRESLQVSTNAIVAFASEDSVSAGSYKFKNVDSPDLEMELYKYVGEFPLGDTERQFVPLLEISPAWMDLEQNEPVESAISRIGVESWSIGVGAGLRMKFFDERLTVTPRFKLAYSDVEYDFSGVSEEADELDTLVPNIESWSYIPSLDIFLDQPLSETGVRVQVLSRISYLHVRASTRSAELNDFTDDSFVIHNQLAYEFSLQEEEDGGSFAVRPAIGRVDVHGAARNGLEFPHFYEFGTEIIRKSPHGEFLREYGVGTTYLYEEEMQGWRFALFGRFS